MRKNQQKGSYSRKSGKNQGRDSKKRKKKDDGRLAGFTTLSQVVGAPKRHAFHSRLPIPVDRIVKETFETCAICGEKIESIASSFRNAEGQLVHFDCALEEIKKANPTSEGQVLSYAGKGNFAIFEKNEEGKWVSVRRIPYESGENYEKMKNYVEENKI